jgi:hypothetical protein
MGKASIPELKGIDAAAPDMSEGDNRFAQR